MSEPGNPENERLIDIDPWEKKMSGERTWKKSDCPALNWKQ